MDGGKMNSRFGPTLVQILLIVTCLEWSWTGFSPQKNIFGVLHQARFEAITTPVNNITEQIMLTRRKTTIEEHRRNEPGRTL